MVKNKQIHHLFTKKTNKKRFYEGIFTILLFKERKRAFGKKLPVEFAENPAVGIERRLFQVFYNILLFIFIHLELFFRPPVSFLGGFVVSKTASRGMQAVH